MFGFGALAPPLPAKTAMAQATCNQGTCQSRTSSMGFRLASKPVHEKAEGETLHLMCGRVWKPSRANVNTHSRRFPPPA